MPVETVLELGDLVDDVDQIDALVAVEVALVDSVDAHEPDCWPLTYARCKVIEVPCVSEFVVDDLVLPIVDVGGGQPSFATLVAVPEAPVDEDHLAPRCEHKVRAAGQVPAMERVAVSQAV